MTRYQKYLKKIENRLTYDWPYICFAVKKDRLWFLNPFAWRLLGEVKKMVKRSMEIYVQRWPGSKAPICTIESALEEKYNVRLGNGAADLMWRQRWLSDLGEGK